MAKKNKNKDKDKDNRAATVLRERVDESGKVRASAIPKKVYEEEYGQFGGEPYGCLVGDYYFDHSPQDVEMLNEIAQVSASAHSPFIAAAATSPGAMKLR